MSSSDFDRPAISTSAVTRVLDPEDPYALDLGSSPMRVRRLGIFAFWGAVALLLIARVALFDPAATREVGSFPGQFAPALQQR